MSKATIIITCKKCGETFRHEKYCSTSKAAESYEIWAKECIDTCKECYAKNQIIKQSEAVAKEFTLPAIVTGTEKQIAFAEKLRLQFVHPFSYKLQAIRAMLNGELDAQIEQVANADFGGDKNKAIIETVKAQNYWREYIALTSTDAKELIGTLN